MADEEVVMHGSVGNVQELVNILQEMADASGTDADVIYFTGNVYLVKKTLTDGSVVYDVRIKEQT
jgi:hypothetical protein